MEKSSGKIWSIQKILLILQPKMNEGTRKGSLARVNKCVYAEQRRPEKLD